MNNEKKGLNISAKSFVTAIAIIFVLMVLTYGLTFAVADGLPFWKWILSPILVLGTEDSGSVLTIIAFLLVIGGIFNSLEKSGWLKYILDQITWRYGKNRKILLAVVTLFFMLLGSFIGLYEESIPLVPIVVALAVRLGWDVLTGLGMSLLAIGCGFAAGVCNPFTVGVAQELAGLPMFSGVWLRAFSFVIIYTGLMIFLYRHANKVAKPLEMLEIQEQYRASIPVVKMKELVVTFWNGIVSVIPAIFMILMANSIKYTLVEAGALDIILNRAILIAQNLPGWSVILFVYLIVLVMNFFIPSGSAKAFLLMPLIVPVAHAFDISAQLCVMAFAFGDGFSNVFYPTNPVLLIALGLADMDYGTWAKWSIKYQIVNLVLTALILLFGLAIGYA